MEADQVMNEQRIEKRTGMDRIHMGCITRVGTITLSVPRIRGGKFPRQSSLVVTREVNKR
ncbi:hypothetical protein P7H16_15610 [Paenibacillus larvae]|nr:hypothetical protein [Paenibacillus larvae]MDT2248082.1 hypothetical protein [Paenibacillus larvae]